jgi:hypothetical protein
MIESPEIVYIGEVIVHKLLKSLLVIFALATSAFAQRDLATLLGTISDPQGAVVPNAKVTIAEDATGLFVRSHG